MNGLAASFLTALFLSGVAQAFSLANLDPMEDIVIHDRLLQILNRQKSIQYLCYHDRRDLTRIEAAFPKAEPIAAENLQSQETSLEIRGRVLELMHRVRDNIPATQACSKEMGMFSNVQDMLSPRRHLPGKNLMKAVCMDPSEQWGCSRSFGRMWQEVQPHCFVSNRMGLGRFIEKNACFGGDLAMEKTLNQVLGDDKPLWALRFSERLFQQVQASSQESAFEISEALLSLRPQADPELTLALIAAVGSSGNSAMTGWLQSLEDLWLIQGLASQSRTIQQVYVDAKTQQRAKILYQGFRDQISRKHMRLTLFGRDVHSWNRHNFMAAFLGCRFQSEKFESVSHFVTLMGIGYESQDFVSHLLEGNSWKVSAQNFREDTQRYRESVLLGQAACNGAKVIQESK